MGLSEMPGPALGPSSSSSFQVMSRVTEPAQGPFETLWTGRRNGRSQADSRQSSMQSWTIPEFTQIGQGHPLKGLSRTPLMAGCLSHASIPSSFGAEPGILVEEYLVEETHNCPAFPGCIYTSLAVHFAGGHHARHRVSYHPQHPNPGARMPRGSGSPRPKEALHPHLGCYRLRSRRYRMMRGVVSPPCASLQLPGESSVQDSQRGAPCHETKLPLHVPLSSWGLSGHQQDQAGTAMQEEEEKECSSAAMPAPPLSLFLLASPPRAHSLLPPRALLVPAASSHSFPPAPAALSTSKLPHTEQNTLHHVKQEPSPWHWESQTRPGLALPFLPGERWGWKGWQGRRKREQTPSPQTSKSSSAGAFGTV